MTRNATAQICKALANATPEQLAFAEKMVSQIMFIDDDAVCRLSIVAAGSRNPAGEVDLTVFDAAFDAEVAAGREHVGGAA